MLSKAWVRLWSHVRTQKFFPFVSKGNTILPVFSLATWVPIQDGAPEWHEGVVNGQGVGDTIVSFNLDGLYRETNQVAHHGHQLEVARQPPWGCRNLQRVAERQMICIEVLRAAFVCGDSTLFCSVLEITFLDIFKEWGAKSSSGGHLLFLPAQSPLPLLLVMAPGFYFEKLSIPWLCGLVGVKLTSMSRDGRLTQTGQSE